MSTSKLLNDRRSISVTWGLSILLVVIGMLYLGFHGFFARSVAEFFVFTITVMMILVSIVLTQFDLFFLEKNFFESAQSWFVGFVTWFMIGLFGSSDQSLTETSVDQASQVIAQNPQGILESTIGLITVRESVLYSSIAGQIPSDWNIFLNNVVNPITEEAFFAVALPVFFLGIMKKASGLHPALRFLGLPAVQMVVLLATIPPLFAVFHVGKMVYAFLIAAIIFRTILTVMLWGDMKLNVIPYIVVLPMFLVGSHMGNNFGHTGIQKTVSFLFTTIPGILTFTVFTIFTVGALYKPIVHAYRIFMS